MATRLGGHSLIPLFRQACAHEMIVCSPPMRLVLVTDQFSCVRVSVVHIFRQVIVLRSPNHKNIAVALLLRQLFVSSVPRQSCYCISQLYLCCVQCLSSFVVLFLEVKLVCW